MARFLYGGSATIADGSVTPPKLNLTSVDDTNIAFKTSGTQTDDPPALIFNRESTTVADDMDLGKISFKGQNSAAEEIEYAQIFVQSSDVTDADEAGEIIISAYTGGRAGTAALQECLVIGMESTDPAQRGFALQINRQQHSDLDLIVRGDNNANLIRTRCEDDHTGIGGAPDAAIGSVFQVVNTAESSLPWPRMTLLQRGALSNQTGGCVIWQTDSTPGLYVYDGANWSKIN